MPRTVTQCINEQLRPAVNPFAAYQHDFRRAVWGCKRSLKELLVGWMAPYATEEVAQILIEFFRDESD
jgi:hypothetical protein